MDVNACSLKFNFMVIKKGQSFILNSKSEVGQSRKREESWVKGQEGLGRKDLDSLSDSPAQLREIHFGLENCLCSAPYF